MDYQWEIAEQGCCEYYEKCGLDTRWIIIVKNIISLNTILVALTVGEAVGEPEDSGSNVGYTYFNIVR